MTRARPLTADEIAAVRKPYRAASLLPGRAYHDPAIYDFERERWFRRDWVVVGREEDAAAPGTLLPGRGRRRAAHRRPRPGRRPARLLQRLPPPRHGGRRGAVRQGGPLPVPVPRLDLRPRRAARPRQAHRGPRRLQPRDVRAGRRSGSRSWQGFVFVSLDPEAQPLVDWLGDLAPHLDRFDFGALRVAHTETYEVDANWKFVAENYSECYHCPGIHPQLNKLTPYDLGGDFAPDGPWQGGWMELVDDAETMALDGGHRAGRPAMAGITELDERRIYYYLVWPRRSCRSTRTTCSSTARAGRPGPHPVVCEWLFEPATIAAPGFDPSDAIGFWDLTNRQDWHVCELQQRGTRSRSWVGRPLLQPGAERPRLRPDGRRPLRGGRHRSAADGPLALRRPAAEGRRRPIADAGDVPAILLPRSAAGQGEVAGHGPRQGAGRLRRRATRLAGGAAVRRRRDRGPGSARAGPRSSSPRCSGRPPR